MPIPSRLSNRYLLWLAGHDRFQRRRRRNRETAGIHSTQSDASMLQAVIDDPTPGPSVLPEQKLSASSEAFLTADARKNLRQVLIDLMIQKIRVGEPSEKFLYWDVVEYCMVQAKQGILNSRRWGGKHHRRAPLIDPVWGGECQYSTDGDWKHPHFEKIMQMQAEIFGPMPLHTRFGEIRHICKRQKDFAAISRSSSLRRRVRFLPVKTPILYRASMRPTILGSATMNAENARSQRWINTFTPGKRMGYQCVHESVRGDGR